MIVLSKKRISIVILGVFLSVFTFMFASSKNEKNNTVATVTLPVSGKTVVLDAGHGTPDEGAQSSSGTTEAQTNLKIALKVQNLLEQSGCTVILTRSDESAIYDVDSKTLKQKNLLENTTICMFSDHYAYYNDISLQIYGYKHSDFVHPELYNIPAFIFDTKLANKLTSNHTNNQKLYDTSFALPESLLPTLLDVLNINYNPSYYLGVSIWDENNNHNVQISYLGGVLNENFFSWDVFTIENPYDYTELDYLGKRYQFFCDSIYKYTKAKFLDNMYTYNEKIFNQIKVG